MNVVTSRAQFRFFNVKKCEEECQLQLILCDVLICGHPVGGDPGDMARDFSTNGANFKLGMGVWDCFCTFVARSRGKTYGVRFAAALLEMELETLLKDVIITMR